MNETDAATPPENLFTVLEGAGVSVRILLQSILTQWSLIQFLVIIACALAALMAKRMLMPRIDAAIIALEARPFLHQFLEILARRLKWMVFAALLWAVGFIMLELMKWPSRSYFIFISANLVTAWVIISVASRFVQNRTFARLLALTVWVIVALNILGLVGQTIGALQALAITLGDSRISLFDIIQVIFLFAVLLWLASLTGHFIERQLRGNEDVAPSLQVLISKVSRVILFGSAIMISLSVAGIDLTVLTVFSGAVGLGIGFGLQKVVSNLLSGMIILLDKSIKPGDVISLKDQFGWITSLSARYVSVVTRDGVEYLIPNEDFITQQVINWSYTNRQVRLEVHFGVSYSANPHEVRKLVAEAIREVDRVLSSPGPVCHMTGFGESSLDFTVRFWIRDPEGGLTNIRGQIFLAIWDVLKENNISIPYPHREIIVHNPAGVKPAEIGLEPPKPARRAKKTDI